MKKLREVVHRADVCVVGGGMSGIATALAAARKGAKVVLMHERPVLGGNASSECRVHICGADIHNGIKNMRETGILEELRLENLYCNPNRNFSIWDSVLYEKVKFEKNITLLLNCSCMDAKMKGKTIDSVKGWQLTTETMHLVVAKVFVDCSGDGILAPLTGAEFKMGRESRKEFGESIAPVKADSRTMGMTCFFQSREYSTPQPFEPPKWARKFVGCDELPYGKGGHAWFEMGYWWLELGEESSIHGTEETRDELLKIVFGVWDHIKNHCPDRQKAENWAIDWIQFLPAKRESRRFVADHILTQHDIEAGGHFDDIVGYGGWSMDDHNMDGFNAVKKKEPATIFHHAPSPYGIPYRCLYSKNIGNLMFAGRNVSCTHAAMSSTRVMGTCMTMGEAVGTAAAMAVRKKIRPRQISNHIGELQQSLIGDDCYLPWLRQDVPKLTLEAELSASQGDPEPVRDGISRPVGDNLHRWDCSENDTLTYKFKKTSNVKEVTIILDSSLDKNIAMSQLQPDDQHTSIPERVPRKFRIEGLADGKWRSIAIAENNYQRHVRLKIGKKLSGIRFVLEKTWGGSGKSSVYALYCR